MIRKGQVMWSAASAKSVCCHGFILGLFTRQAKFPISSPGLGSTTKVQTHLAPISTRFAAVTHECELFYRQAPGVTYSSLAS